MTFEVRFTDHWYNVLHMAARKVCNNLWPSNIAMSVAFHGATLRCFDPDIDLQCPDDGQICRGQQPASRHGALGAGDRMPSE